MLPTFAFAVSKLAQFSNRYNETHWKAAKGVLRYLRGTTSHGITYRRRGSLILKSYTDSDYAGDKISRKSATAMVVTIDESPISWQSQKQPCVALSSTEAEYIAPNVDLKDVKWPRAFLSELTFAQPEPTTVFVDNQSAIKLSKNPEMHSRTKHIDVRYHFTRNLIEQGEISVTYIPTTEQLADSLTKPLMKTKLVENRKELGLHETVTPRANVSRLSPWTVITLLLMVMLSACADPLQAEVFMVLISYPSKDLEHP
ncbi:unnamed protein product [Allacma fusca]|uniref:Copia protein n=1 Tax=Allacma fusca TaxID=39272 RepID=A0A8J2KZ78_9HEXA|nr:unnamed protein product [Allacma fusca]